MSPRSTDFATGLVLKLFILALLAAVGLAIQCYDCSSAHDPNCGDNPFDPGTLGTIDCNLKKPLDHIPKNATLCRKLVQTVFGKQTVVRRCGYIEDPVRDDKACVKRSGTHDVSVVYCSCHGDLCNAAPPRLTSGTHLLLAAAVGLAALFTAAAAPS